jgi:hypothetical protein
VDSTRKLIDLINESEQTRRALNLARMVRDMVDAPNAPFSQNERQAIHDWFGAVTVRANDVAEQIIAQREETNMRLRAFDVRMSHA